MQIGAVNFSGLFSGLDVEQIVGAIIKGESLGLENVQAKQTNLESKRSALEEIRSALSGLRFKLRDIATLARIAGKTVSSTTDTVAKATASSSAQTGSFTIDVQTLAAAHKVRSIEVADRFSPVITDGTLTIQSGSGDVITINVAAAAGNNTLVGVRDAINAADSGVTASIVDVGSGDVLIIRSEETGTTNSLTITDSTSLDLTGAGSLVQAAANATVVVEGLTVTSSSNKISGALAGVTLDLISTGTTTLTVANDTETVREGLEEFIEEYNTVIDLLNKHTSSGIKIEGTSEDGDDDDEVGGVGVLFSDSTARRIREDLALLVSSSSATVPGGDLRSLSGVGVDLDGRTGKLSINTLRLDETLENSFDALRSVFLSTGLAADAAVLVQSAGFGAQGSYAIQITQASEAAQVAGSTALQGGGLAADENLTITVGSDSIQVALLAGDTIADVVGKVNTALQQAGVQAIALDAAGVLSFTANDHGSAVTLSVVSDVVDAGDGSSTGIGTTALNDTGVDVAGTINGAAATGVGQILTADADTVADGLALRILADATAVAAKGGDFGSVSVTHGLRRTLGDRLSLLSDPFDGTVSSARDGLDARIRSLENRVEQMERRLARRREILTIKFAAAERALAQLQLSEASLKSIGLF